MSTFLVFFWGQKATITIYLGPFQMSEFFAGVRVVARVCSAVFCLGIIFPVYSLFLMK
jgi:1,4-dihydroxy-2-naphthoate octaprenyltransferase